MLVRVWMGLVFLAPLARAEPSQAPSVPPKLPPPLHVEYAAPGNCPTEADFEAGVQGRTSFARFGDEPDARAVHVVVTPTGGTYAGHLSIVGRSGRVSERIVEDVHCSEVIDALALVTALAVDPNATLSMAPAPPSASPAPTTPPLGAASPDSSVVTPLLSPPSVSATNPRPTRISSPSSVPRASHPGSGAPGPKWGAAAGASFVTMSGIAPDALAGGGGFAEIESESRRWLAPSVRLTAFAAENGVFKDRTVSFLLVGARADVCPVRLGSRDLSIRPCVSADLGEIRAEGIAVTSPQQAVVAWFDAAALLRARWAPGRGLFFVEGEAGILIPVTHPRYVYENPSPPNTMAKPAFPTQYNTPQAGAAGSLAVGLRFW